MFIRRKKQSVSVFNGNLDHAAVEINNNLSQDIHLQLTMIDLTKNDLAILKLIQPHIKENVEQMTTGFYARVMSVPHLTKIIKSNSTIERLRDTLRIHIMEMFAGVIDKDFVSKRDTIAHVHVRIGLASKWYMAAFNVIFEISQKIILENVENSEDRMMAINAVNEPPMTEVTGFRVSAIAH